MSDVFFVPTAIATAVSYAGFIGWIIAYSLSWGFFTEGAFFGVAVGGLICGAMLGFAEPNKTTEGKGS